jgi:hypothetical protein
MDEYMQDKIAIVLTGTIVPNSILTTHIDADVRRKEYLRSIHFYTKLAPVYFLENSTYPLEEDEEFTSIPNLFIRKMPLSLFYDKGKGYQEFEMIDRWIDTEHNPPLKWLKISGRYIFKNCSSIIEECINDDRCDLAIDRLLYHHIAYTDLFYTTTEYYTKKIVGIYKLCDDVTGEYIEKVIFQKIAENETESVRIFVNSAKTLVTTGSTSYKKDDGGITYLVKSILRYINRLFDRKYLLYPIKIR